MSNGMKPIGNPEGTEWFQAECGPGSGEGLWTLVPRLVGGGNRPEWPMAQARAGP